jgi:D-alanine-D-alanine ligase
MKTIGIVYGGYSSEIVVSRKSAEGIATFLDTSRYRIFPVLLTQDKWVVTINNEELPVNRNDFSFQFEGQTTTFDCLYITIHGAPGENGLLQGYLDMLNIPHTTCEVLPSALTFNKFMCNTYLKGFGIAVPDSILIRRGNTYNPEEIVDKLGLPCFVKPNAGGSSFGITKVKEARELEGAIQKAFEESCEVIIETFLKGTEVTCGLYKTLNKEELLPLTEVISKNDFFDFEAKYNAEKATEITPARLSDELTRRIQEISSLAYTILNCKGIVRMDYIITDQKIYLLEINTTPGMTTTSFIPQQVRAKNLKMSEVLSEVIEDAINRSAQ